MILQYQSPISICTLSGLYKHKQSRNLDINPNDWNREVTGMDIQVATADTQMLSLTAYEGDAQIH